MLTRKEKGKQVSILNSGSQGSLLQYFQEIGGYNEKLEEKKKDTRQRRKLLILKNSKHIPNIKKGVIRTAWPVSLPHLPTTSLLSVNLRSKFINYVNAQSLLLYFMNYRSVLIRLTHCLFFFLP